MKKLLGIWRAMTGAERVVAAAALLALASCPVFAAAALLERPGDILNPNAAFDSNAGSRQEVEQEADGEGSDG